MVLGASAAPGFAQDKDGQKAQSVDRTLSEDAPQRGEERDRGVPEKDDDVEPMPQPKEEVVPPVIVPPRLPRFERFELVTQAASVQDSTGNRPGNSWGGHQTRVLRMRNGDVYTVYLTTGQTFDSSEWHLVRRSDVGWQRVASGIAGREPVNILRTPGDGVAVVAWPRGSPLLTTLDFSDGGVERSERRIPGQWEVSHWPYNAAGISLDGALCALQSPQQLSPSALLWACGGSPDGTWTFHKTPIVHRHAYAYVLPGAKRLTLLATRDVTWRTLGYARPPGASDFAFNQIHAYGTENRATAALGAILVREELPTAQYPAPLASGQVDAYVDTKGRLHVLYRLTGQSTGGWRQTRHALVTNGKVVADVELPEHGYWRLTQDSTGRFWALYGTGNRFAVYPALSEDGLQLGPPIELDLGDEQVRYSGMAIAAPRAGVPLDDIVDGGFPSGAAGERWVYFRLRLR